MRNRAVDHCHCPAALLTTPNNLCADRRKELDERSNREMGQAFFAVFLAEDSDQIAAYADPYDYNAYWKLREHGYVGSSFTLAVERTLFTPRRLVWAGDYADPEPGTEPPANLFARCESAPVMPDPDPGTTGRYVINHDKRCYINKYVSPANEFGYRTHPLVAFTAEGCGRGLGDFVPDHPLIGTWARDHISVSDIAPDDFRELMFMLEFP
ncbi:hypothetical protein K7711_46800 [Nocardia sp. CA2R105]|uniref:hypothetical protein n=1 Tax=Nocardia coffeae TaxID=2873381 RepID=UPI001CA6BF73|nr:hypothetical protein [Nocardia coffeae]MBY8864042.1 hypothetical protein [Nocardia coffeae]